MKVLVIGSGAREHAIIKALQKSKQIPQLFCCGTSNNPGIADFCEAYWQGDITQSAVIAELAKDWQIDCAIIGPEAPLEKHLADQLTANNIGTIGPLGTLARIESSKSFARQLMQKYEIPGSPISHTVSDLAAAQSYLQQLGDHYVIKADGLMGGKGVKVSGEHITSHAEALAFCQQILDKNQAITLEEKLLGEEFSLMCFCDGQTLIPMPLVQDHKRAYVDDTGPNTGGMGSYTDANHQLPFLTDHEVRDALTITQKVYEALQTECQQPYIGILYGSFMATANGVYVIEFNARFGDPECLNILTLLQNDFLELCTAMLNGNLSKTELSFAKLATVCKYAVPEGYPDQPVKHALLDLSQAAHHDHWYLASVDAKSNGLWATGSRAAAFVGVAPTIAEAEALAEAAMADLKGPFYHRKDIGTMPLIRKRMVNMQNLRKPSCA